MKFEDLKPGNIVSLHHHLANHNLGGEVEVLKTTPEMGTKGGGTVLIMTGGNTWAISFHVIKRLIKERGPRLSDNRPMVELMRLLSLCDYLGFDSWGEALKEIREAKDWETRFDLSDDWGPALFAQLKSMGY